MSEFDKFAGDYEALHAKNIRVSGFEASYFDELKIKEIYRFLKSEKRENRKMNFLNFGCGIGKSERFIRKYFPRSAIFSIDVSERSVEVAKERNRELGDVTFQTFNGQTVPFETTFDVIFIANVFHHIPFEQHVVILKNLYQKIPDDGVLFFFEHNPINIVTVYTVRACEFDKDARLLNPFYANTILSESGFAWRKITFIIFFPKFLSFLIPYEKYLKKVPLGAQYYFAAKKCVIESLSNDWRFWRKA